MLAIVGLIVGNMNGAIKSRLFVLFIAEKILVFCFASFFLLLEAHYYFCSIDLFIIG